MVNSEQPQINNYLNNTQKQNMETIRLQRPNSLKDSARDYKIFIDGQQVGTIGNDETKNLPTTAGQHIVTVKLDYHSSNITIEVKENQTKNLKVSGPKMGLIMQISLGLIVLYIILTKFTDFEYTKFLIIPALILTVYDVIKGWKKYLTLEELNDN